MKIVRTHYPYLIGSDLSLDGEDTDHLVRLFENKPDLVTEILHGRNAVVKDTLCGIPMVVKFYKRGGLIRHVMRDAYLRSGKSRSLLEYEMLEKARTLGVACPEPLAWAMRGSLFYKAFLVTREIENARSLVDLCHDSEASCLEALEKTIDQTRRLIESRIHHVDLHPGNVLINGKGDVYLIDFDKAHPSPLSRKKLINAVIRRWKRAVAKYHLPEMMAEVFERGLRNHILP